MVLPKQVQEAGERADRLMVEMQEEQRQQREGARAPSVPAVTEPAHAAPPMPPVVLVAAEVQPAAVTSPPMPQELRTDWKAKYHVLKGKYDAEVPRLTVLNRELRESLQARDQEIATLKSNATPQSGNTAVQLDDDFDPALRAMIERRVEVQVGAATKPVVEQVEAQRMAQAQSAWDRFLSDVEAEVEDFRTIDAEDSFQAWAGEIESLSGKTRGELLDDAIAQLNSSRVIAIYTQYRQAVKGAPPIPQPKEVVVPVPLEERVVPVPNAAAAPLQVPKIISREEIARFYADVTRGLYRNRMDEANRIEAEINSAYSEGRVK